MTCVAVSLPGSFVTNGALRAVDSLEVYGALKHGGSLAVYGALSKSGSGHSISMAPALILVHSVIIGILYHIGSFSQCGTLVKYDSFVSFGTLG